MAKSIDDKVAYYYDSHPTEEDLMGETAVHAALVRYQMSVLHWLLREQHCAIYENLNFYQTPNPNEYPLAPDIAIIKGVDYLGHIHSWRVGKTGPAPHVVFEIASDETWKKDLHEKPRRYAQMGVQEYFAYDPQQPSVYRSVAGRRLFGWQLGQGVVQEMAPGLDGRLWSAQLNSFLLPDGQFLRLLDRDGYLRLTEAEAERKARKAESLRAEIETRRAEVEARRAKAEARRAEAERQRAEAEAEARKAEMRRAETEKQRAEVEKQRAETEKQRAEVEKQRAETEKRRAEALAEKLRSLGIDPDTLA